MGMRQTVPWNGLPRGSTTQSRLCQSVNTTVEGQQTSLNSAGGGAWLSST